MEQLRFSSRGVQFQRWRNLERGINSPHGVHIARICSYRVANVVSSRLCNSTDYNYGGQLGRTTWSGRKWIKRKRNKSLALKVRNCTPETTLGAEVDVVLLSNGPGEVATWVKPIVDSLRRQYSGTKLSVRISVVLTPCPHASGRELELVRSYIQVDRCQGPDSFWNLLLLGITEGGWSWRRRGVCIFLGGDQVYTVLLSRRLGYKSVVYSEESVLWPGLVDVYMLRSERLLRAVPQWAHSKCKVVGDLFSDSVFEDDRSFSKIQAPKVPIVKGAIAEVDSLPVVGILPGSKDRMNGRVRFLLPLAPTATLSMLAEHADAIGNPFISQFEWASGAVVRDNHYVDFGNERLNVGAPFQLEAVGYLVTNEGVHIEILQKFPVYDVFRLCSLCVTTIGTNTAELGYLGIPMLVVLPTHALEVFKGGTGGVVGMLANVPGGLGHLVAQKVNSGLLKSSGYLAWPNRWAEKEIVPEVVGRIEPREVAGIAAHYLADRGKMDKMQNQLLNLHLRSEATSNTDDLNSGAADAIALEVCRLTASDG